MPLTRIDDALRRIRRGEMVLVVDDEDRENEGDLTLAAEWVTPEAINFMLRWARGLVCMPCDAARLDELEIGPMVAPGVAGCDTAFTVSIDHRERGQRHRCGRSRADDQQAVDRGRRVRSTSSVPGTSSRCAPAAAVCSSGVVTPRRPSISLGSRGCAPVAVICEVLHDDGSPARFPYLEMFAQEHRIAMISVDQLAEYRSAGVERRRRVRPPVAPVAGRSRT